MTRIFSPNTFLQARNSLLSPSQASFKYSTDHLKTLILLSCSILRKYLFSVCVFGEPTLKSSRAGGDMAGIKMTSERHGSGKENRAVLTSNLSLVRTKFSLSACPNYFLCFPSSDYTVKHKYKIIYIRKDRESNIVSEVVKTLFPLCFRDIRVDIIWYFGYLWSSKY